MKLQNGIIKFMKELSIYDTMQLVLLQNKIHIELMKRKQDYILRSETSVSKKPTSAEGT